MPKTLFGRCLLYFWGSVGSALTIGVGIAMLGDWLKVKRDQTRKEDLNENISKGVANGRA